MKFTDFGLNPNILKALEEKGYDTPTEVQEKTLEAFVSGKHILGQSQTGSGKTAAFVLPLLNAIDTDKREPQVIILAPTRELAAQIRDEVYDLSKHMYMRSLSCFGGTSKRKQIEELRKGPQIIVGTPGRVMDLIDSRHLKLQGIKYFVLDEVDRMLDMGFIDAIEAIWNRLDTIEQALTFSATLPNEVMGLVKQFIGDDYAHIQVSQTVVVDTVDHMFMQVPSNSKYAVLTALINGNPGIKTLIFTETKLGADDLAYRLDQDGHTVDALHGDMDQRDRFRTLKRIKENEVNILVATDVAARGLNMNKVDLVINYQVPNDPESYVHRIGRTARAGLTGNAIMFVDRNEYRKLHAIERVSKVKIKQVNEAGEEIERTDKAQRGQRKGGGGGGSDNKYRFRRAGGSGGEGRAQGRSSGSRSSYGGSSRGGPRGASRGGSSYSEGGRSAGPRSSGERSDGARTGSTRSPSPRTAGARSAGSRTSAPRSESTRTGGARTGGSRSSAPRTGGGTGENRTRAPRAGGSRFASSGSRAPARGSSDRGGDRGGDRGYTKRAR